MFDEDNNSLKNTIQKYINPKIDFLNNYRGNIQIIISDKYNIPADFSLPFSDIEKRLTENLVFSENAPEWRKVEKGLNIFGICKFPKSKAFQKEVIFITKMDEQGLNINLNEKEKIKCPIIKL